MSKKVFVDFSGSIEVDKKNTNMQYIGPGDGDGSIITVEEWSNLPSNERGNWILESLSDAIKASLDEKYEEIEICVEELEGN